MMAFLVMLMRLHHISNHVCIQQFLCVAASTSSVMIKLLSEGRTGRITVMPMTARTTMRRNKY